MLVQWPRLVTRSGSTHFDRSIVGSLDQITIEHTPHFMIEHDRAHRYSPPMQARGPGRLSVKSSCSSSCCTLRQAQLHEWTSMVAKTFQTGVHNLAKVGLAPARVFLSLPHRRLIYSRVCKVHVPPEHREQLETLCRLAPSALERPIETRGSKDMRRGRRSRGLRATSRPTGPRPPSTSAKPAGRRAGNRRRRRPRGSWHRES